MAFTPRLIAGELARAARQFPAVLLTGPRRAGKTTLLQHLFPRADYHLMEDPDVIARVRSDPRTFLDAVRTPAILDEIQNVPEILRYVRSRIDAEPQRKGRWILTGSQEAPLMKGVTESMAGRAAVLQLLPLSTLETSKASLLRGGFPEPLARPSAASLWFRSYVQTYLERDVRAIASIRDLATFRRFVALLASRCGQILNRTEIAAPLGITVPTLNQWLGILEITGQIVLVQPFFENFGKRIIKSPKPYFVDSGLACHLLGIETERALTHSPFLGPLFEGFVASEILKQQLASGHTREIYYFRDQQGLEVDFLVPAGHRQLLQIEAKATRTPQTAMSTPMQRLKSAIRGFQVRSVVVHRPARETRRVKVLSEGVEAVTLSELLHELPGSKSARRSG